MFLRKNNFKLRYFILILLFLSLILMLWGRNFLSESLFFKKVLQFNLSLAKPAFSLKNQAVSFGQNIKGYFQTKKNLSDSNRLLEEENSELTAEVLKLKVLEKENSELLNLLGRKPESDFLIASILYRPPMSNFDTFIVDVGLKQGIQKGMRVMAYNDIILGEVEEVFESFSKIKLYSYYGTQINVFLKPFAQPSPSELEGSSGLSVMARAKGGENFEITLAKDIKVELGDKILTADLRPFILGEVQKIIKNESEPFQKIYFRYPLNLNELRYVYILK